jgi:UDP-glucose 4-epimerase
MKILITGSAGFIAGYLVDELLNCGHEIIGIDNYSKYGKVHKSYDHHPNSEFVEGDVKDTDLMKDLASDCDQVVAMAAMLGGISHFHSYAYDLFAENERIITSTFDAALWAFKYKRLQKINVISSTMVFDKSDEFLPAEGEQLKCSPTPSTYGFQKLACEYFCKGAWEQYGLPYTIIRPSNCIGVGEKRALTDRIVISGDIKLAMSHVVPDLAWKILRGQNPLRILGQGDQLRQYTYGGDMAHGIRLCIDQEKAINEDFNISTTATTTVLELAELIWHKVNPDQPFSYVSDAPLVYDTKKRIASTEKARRLLGFEATTPLRNALDEIIPWVQHNLEMLEGR